MRVQAVVTIITQNHHHALGNCLWPPAVLRFLPTAWFERLTVKKMIAFSMAEVKRSRGNNTEKNTTETPTKSKNTVLLNVLAVDERIAC